MEKLIELNDCSFDKIINECEKSNNKKYKASIIIQIVSFTIMLVMIFSISYISSAAKTFDDISNKVLRLHILANSNSKEDQELKLKVRDRILEKTSYIFNNVTSKEELLQKAEENKELICETAISVLRENNCYDDVTVEIGKSDFPTKKYEDIILPKGEYNAIRVLIGEHKGKNWWCVAFPSLCFSDSIKNDNKEKMGEILKEDEMELVSTDHLPKVQVKFFVIELIEEIKANFKN